jgi:colanic acid/amylovoran biosynthesis glycosyltransferase
MLNALFEKLKYLAENPERWAEMGHRGRKIVEARYDINLLNDKLVGIFNELLKNDLHDATVAEK